MSIEECEAVLKMLGKGGGLAKWREWLPSDYLYLAQLRHLIKLHTGQYDGDRNQTKGA